MLKVKTIFGPTIQGEGPQSGLAAIFIRFAGCNMWDGRPETRADSQCPYCDTDFFGGNLYSPVDVAMDCWKLRKERGPGGYLAVLTGGEPLLQPKKDFVQLLIVLRSQGFKTQIETNGTRWDDDIRANVDFITVSPKVSLDKLLTPLHRVDCLKLLHPHPTVDYREFLELPQRAAYRDMDFCIQPIEPPAGGKTAWDENVRSSVELVKSLGYPWRLNLQIHKILGEE